LVSLPGGIEGYLNFCTAKTTNLATGARLTNSPEYLLGAGITVPLWAEKLYVSPAIRFVDQRSAYNGVDTDSYFLVNLSITTAKLFDSLDLSLHVFNLFDEEYLVPGGDTEFNYRPGTSDYIYFNIPQEGRSLHLQIAYRF